MKLPLLLLGAFAILLAVSVAGGLGWVASSGPDAPPGVGLIGLAFFDLLLLYSLATLILQAAGIGGLVGRVQWFSAIGSGLALAVLGMIGIAITLQLLGIMVGFLLAVPFGTVIYMAVYGSFDTDTVRRSLALVFACKLLGFGLVAAAAPGILRNVQLMVLAALSLLFTFGLGLLYAYVPGFLASIADAVGAIVFVGTAVFLAVLLALSGLMSLVRAIRGLAPI